MDVPVERGCGLDLHKASVAACLRLSPAGGEPGRAIRAFGTTPEDLVALADRVAGAGCTHVAMEATGVSWKPSWHLLEDGFDLLPATPRHLKAAPGRKTEVADAEWIADLLRHGLLRGGGVPDRPRRGRRAPTRDRASLGRERTAEANRRQQTLEGAHVEPASVATGVLGTSGRGILRAPVAGSEDAAALARLAQGRRREQLPELARALAGRIAPHQRFVLAQQLAHVDVLDAAIARASAEVAARLAPVAEAAERLGTIPGIGRYVAEAPIAEVGADVRRFPTAGHLASWAGMGPGHHERAGKRRRGRTRRGSPWRRALSVRAAHAGARTKGTELQAHHRLAARRGKSRAAVAVGHPILVVASHPLAEGTTDRDLGPNSFDERDRRHAEHRLVRRSEGLGDEVTLTPPAADQTPTLPRPSSDHAGPFLEQQ